MKTRLFIITSLLCVATLRADFPVTLATEVEDFGYSGSTAISCAIDDTGTLAVIGNSSGRTAWIYERDGRASSWSEADALVSSGNPRGFGNAVAISDDGQTLVVADHLENGPGNSAGWVYVFTREASGWSIPVAIQPDLPQKDMRFGESVSIDGDTIVVGASNYERDPDRNSQENEGAVYIFERNLGGVNAWGQRVAIFPAIPRLSGKFGEDVALDGNLLAISATGDRGPIGGDSSSGVIYLYSRNLNGPDTWGFVKHIRPTDGASSDTFGTEIDLEGDTLVSGSPRDDDEGSNSGGVYVYGRNVGGSNNWGRVIKLVPTQLAAGSSFGRSIDLDGNTLAVGADAFGTSNAGGLFVFQRDGAGDWGAATIFQAGSTQLNRNLGDGVAIVEESLTDRSLNGGVLIGGGRNSAVFFEADYSDSTTIPAITDYVREQLYYDNATGSALFDRNEAAFRYKHLLYEDDGSGVRPMLENMTSLFGDTERERAAFAIHRLLRGLEAVPVAESAALQDLLLDTRYDLTVAEAILARESLIDSDIARIDAPLVAGGWIIDEEIADYEVVLPKMRDALTVYFELLEDDLGQSASPPLGFSIFQSRVPGREVMPAEYLVDNVPTPVNDGSAIVSGYRDAVLIYDLLGEYGCTVAALSKLLWIRNESGDIEQARALLGETQRMLFIQGNIIRSVFVDSNGDDPEQLEEVIAQWNEGIADLASAQDELDSTINPLGLERDTLVLKTKPQGAAGEFFDTFDILKDSLSDTDDLFNNVQNALDAQADAVAAYDSYQGKQDELEGQLMNLNDDVLERLESIVGAPFDTLPYNNVPENGGYIAGSELGLQADNIEIARLAIERNVAEINNLQEQVRIEIRRNLFEVQTADAIGKVEIRYGEEKAQVEHEIGVLNQQAKAFDLFLEYIKPENLASGKSILLAVGIGYYLATDDKKQELEAKKERLAGQEKAEIRALNNAVLNRNSQARVETWMLDMKLLVLDSQQRAIQLNQELGRLIALVREKESLERRLMTNATALAGRYFADPVHRLRFQHEYFLAEDSFTEAHRVVFFLARALEYKWNETLQELSNGVVTMGDVYKARNARELERLVLDLASIDSGEANQPEVFSDVFSIREDVFGFDEEFPGDPVRLYADPITGEQVTSKEAFRSQLKLMLTGDLIDDDFVQIVIPFSTFRDPLRGLNGDNFFRGPRVRYNEDGSVTIQSKGKYLDKIESLQITMPGSHSLGRTTLSSELEYGGTAFIRNKTVGNYDGVRKDRVEGEMRSYQTRVSDFGLGGVFETSDTLTGSPTVMLRNDVPGENENVVRIFRERSVASSGWELRIIVKDGSRRLIIDEVDDILIHFKHQAITRQ